MNIDDGVKSLKIDYAVFIGSPLKNVYIGRELNYYMYSPFEGKNITTLTVSKKQSEKFKLGNNTTLITLLNFDNDNCGTVIPENLSSSSTVRYFNVPRNDEYKNTTGYIKNKLNCNANLEVLGDIEVDYFSISVAVNDTLINDPFVWINGKNISKDGSGIYRVDDLDSDKPHSLKLSYTYNGRHYSDSISTYTKRLLLQSISTGVTLSTATIRWHEGDTVGFGKPITECGVYLNDTHYIADGKGEGQNLLYYKTITGLRPGYRYEYRIYYKVGSDYYYSDAFKFTTRTFEPYSLVETTLSTATIRWHEGDTVGYGKPITECGLYFNNEHYKTEGRDDWHDLPYYKKITGLKVGYRYSYRIYYKVDTAYYYSNSRYFDTKQPTSVVIINENTQRTMNLKVFGDFSDEYVSPVEVGVRCNNEYYVADADNNVKIEGLTPYTTYRVEPYVMYEENGTKWWGTGKDITTDSIAYDCTAVTTPTTITFEYSYDIGDCTLVGCGFNGVGADGNTYTLTGLEPNTSYDTEFYLETEEGGRITKTISATTQDIVFTTMKAKAISNTRAIICAETNIANEEVGTGFEFRRIDAPDLVPSDYAGCAVHDGAMEGILENLSANTYYKYRPYYCSANEKYYYGEWIGFGTADAYVYFTPTVHTYASVVTGLNQVRLTGYALAGSENILEQGFEYWIEGAATRASSDVMRVTASGQRMSIVLDNLEYGARYRCRAFVQTTSETVYGEEVVFETGVPLGIDETSVSDAVSVTVSGNTIFVDNAFDGDLVQIYSLRGEAVYNGFEREITVDGGTYIVVVRGMATKVYVK